MENGKLLRERGSGKMVKNEPGSYYFDELIGEVLVHPFEASSAEKQQIVASPTKREMQASKEDLKSAASRSAPTSRPTTTGPRK